MQTPDLLLKSYYTHSFPPPHTVNTPYSTAHGVHVHHPPHNTPYTLPSLYRSMSASQQHVVAHLQVPVRAKHGANIKYRFAAVPWHRVWSILVKTCYGPSVMRRQVWGDLLRQGKERSPERRARCKGGKRWERCQKGRKLSDGNRHMGKNNWEREGGRRW